MVEDQRLPNYKTSDCIKEEAVPDYSVIDQPSVLMFIFYPRKDFTLCPENGFDLLAPVENHVSIHCRFYAGNQQWPWILFFHGNGEVVSDYDEIAPFYHQRRLNLVVADYRGYGKSDGVPTLRDLVQDSRAILREVEKELSKRGFRGDLWIMGRSLGSISAIELAYRYQDSIKGLIIESGFASVVRIMIHLGIPASGTNLERIDQECLEMIQKIFLPTLVIHGEMDMLVPLKEAKDIFKHLGTDKKELVIIPSANHNDIMLVGFRKYFDALQGFVESVEGRKSA
jgi:alpha-beta hydrolase superfamily lysophospholipase